MRPLGRNRRSGWSDVISVSRDTLATLIAATAEEDRGAFARLYQASAGKLYSVCLGILGSRDIISPRRHPPGKSKISFH